MPPPDVLTLLSVMDVPNELLVAMPSRELVTELVAITPAPPKLKMAIDSASPSTLSTVLPVKLKLPPEEA